DPVTRRLHTTLGSSGVTDMLAAGETYRQGADTEAQLVQREHAMDDEDLSFPDQRADRLQELNIEAIGARSILDRSVYEEDRLEHVAGVTTAAVTIARRQQHTIDQG